MNRRLYLPPPHTVLVVCVCAHHIFFWLTNKFDFFQRNFTLKNMTDTDETEISQVEAQIEPTRE